VASIREPFRESHGSSQSAIAGLMPSRPDGIENYLLSGFEATKKSWQPLQMSGFIVSSEFISLAYVMNKNELLIRAETCKMPEPKAQFARFTFCSFIL
jgi:hypothetical protein